MPRVLPAVLALMQVWLCAMCPSRKLTIQILLLLLFLLKTSKTKSQGKHTNSSRDSPAFIPSDEQRLFRKLMRNYEKSVRPVINATTPVPVKLGITLTQIFKLDEKNQVMTTNVWLDQEWIDEKMRWNPDKFGGIKTLRIPCHHIWLPDIVLYNSVDDYTTGYMKSLAMVTFDGNIFWPPIVRFRSSCKVDITYFPFDDQVCHMKLGSWAYDGFQVDVLNRSSNIDLSNYIDNGEWELMDVRARRRVVIYSCCPEPFPDVTFYIHIRRRTTYYTFNVIIPCVILSILTIAGFFLPAESGEKVTLGLTVLLAFSVFMLLIAESMPATSEFVPLIGIYLTVTMAMTSMSVIFSVFVLHVHHRGSLYRRAPPWVRKAALTLSRFVCHKSTPLLSLRSTKDKRYSRHGTSGGIDGRTHFSAPSSRGAGARRILNNGTGGGLSYASASSGAARRRAAAHAAAQATTALNARSGGLQNHSGGGYGSFNQGFRLSSIRNVTLKTMENGEYVLQHHSGTSQNPGGGGSNNNNVNDGNSTNNANNNSDVYRPMTQQPITQGPPISSDSISNANSTNNNAPSNNNETSSTLTAPGESSSSSGSSNSTQNNKVEQQLTNATSNATYRQASSTPTTTTATLEEEMLLQLRTIIDCYEREEKEESINREWADIAIVFDRTLFWFMFVLATTVTLSLLIFKPMMKNVSIDDYL